MKYISYLRFCLLALPLLTARCSCDEKVLRDASPSVPLIDICALPSPDAAEVCYSSLKSAWQCDEGEECPRPQMQLDTGAVSPADGGSVPVRVLNLGEAELLVQVPILQNATSPQAFRIDDVESSDGEHWTTLAPGEEQSFTVRRRGSPCGAHQARIAVFSNDGDYEAVSTGSWTPPQKHSPVFINLSGSVDGPCLCGPEVVNFGGTVVSRSAEARYTFESCGEQPLVVSDAAIGVNPNDVFAVAGTSFASDEEMAPGTSGYVDLTYTPDHVHAADESPDLGRLWLSTNVTTVTPHYEVSLGGHGIPRPACALEALPHTTSFGNVAAPLERIFRLFNDGEIACRLFELEHSDGSLDFVITDGALDAGTDATLFPGDSYTLKITFTPATEEFQEATFTAKADDIDGFESIATIQVSANPEIPAEGCVLQVQPDFGDFGEITVGEITSEDFLLSNESGAGLGNLASYCKFVEPTITLHEGAPDFRLGDMGGIIGALVAIGIGIPPGVPLSESLTVFFEPQSEGIKTGILRFHTEDGPRDVQLWGNALGGKLCVDVGDGPLECGATAPCATADFGSTPTAVSRDVTLGNCGGGVLKLRGINLDGAGSAAFVKDQPQPEDMPIVLGPTEQTIARISYTPSGAPDFGGLDVISNATNNSVARIDLRGNYDGSCATILRCNPAAVDFGNQEIGSVPAFQTAICSNFGTEPLQVQNVALSGSGDLSISGDTTATLGPGESFPVQVVCDPSVAGALTGTITLTSTACDTSPLTVPVECTGIEPDIPQCIGSSTFEPRELWRWEGTSDYPSYDDVWMTPVVINLTDDNSDGTVDVLDTPDVIFVALESKSEIGGGGEISQEQFCHSNDAKPAVVVAVSGDTGAELWTWGTLPANEDPGDANALAMQSQSTLAAADIDADGLPEIIGLKYTYIAPDEDCDMMADPNCCVQGKFAYGSLIALEHDGTYKWESERYHQSEVIIEDAGAVSVGDMNGDGFPEIAIGNAVFDRHGMLIFEGRTETQADPGDGEGCAGHGAISVFVDVDGDGTNELVAGRTAFDFDGSIIWEAEIADGLTTVANIDSDPNAEIIILTEYNDLYVLDGENGNIKYGPKRIESGNVNDDGEPEGFISTNPAIGDLDGDGFAEIVVAATNNVWTFEHDLSDKWSQPVSDQSGASGPSTFDFEGDGRAEVVYADEGDVYIWDGVNGSTKYVAPRNSRTIIDNPVIVDVNNDGHADILLAMEAMGTVGMHGLIAYSNTSNNWVGTRRVWNQHGYHVTNISESGVVPAQEGAGWLEHNVYRSNVVRCE